MPLGGANLFFDQIKVVEQPFPRRGNPAVCLDRLNQQVANFNEDGLYGLLGRLNRNMTKDS
jgi:hypothetical protein